MQWVALPQTDLYQGSGVRRRPATDGMALMTKVEAGARVRPNLKHSR